VPPTVEDDLRLLKAFACYARRQLGPDGPSVAHVELGQSLRRAPADAAVAVVAGARSPMAERIFAVRSGMRPQWRGKAHAATDSPGAEFTIWDRWRLDKVRPAPPGFDVLAIVTTYNEAGIIEQQLQRLINGGIRVHVIDNWSTDGTDQLVSSHAGSGRLTMERFPANGPAPWFELSSLLRRVAEVAHTSGADWVIHHDADEIHDSPWAGVSKRQALWALQQWGFNCADHTVVEFRPVADTWQPKDDLDSSFEWFEFGPAEGHFTMQRAWRPQEMAVSNLESGGHTVDFPAKKIFPYKFPLRHYPLRSTDHARRKLFEERRPRWSPEERARGWHVQYDHLSEDASFVWDPSALQRWSTVDEKLLLQRISGVGLPNNPRPDEATTAA
jgi:hypothetical protein